MPDVYTLLETKVRPRKNVVKTLEGIDLPLLQNNGWLLRTNAALGKEYIAKDLPREYKNIFLAKDSGIELPEDTAIVVAPTQEIIDWADAMLKTCKLQQTEVNRSIVYSIFGYQSKVPSKFIISTCSNLSLKLLQSGLFAGIPVINAQSLEYTRELKNILLDISYAKET